MKPFKAGYGGGDEQSEGIEADKAINNFNLLIEI